MTIAMVFAAAALRDAVPFCDACSRVRRWDWGRVGVGWGIRYENSSGNCMKHLLAAPSLHKGSHKQTEERKAAC